MLVPSRSSCFFTDALAPSPTATMAIRAATPMKTPSMVSTDRMRFRARAWAAAVKIMPMKGQVTPPSRWAKGWGGARAGARAGLATSPGWAGLRSSVRIRPSRMTMVRSANAAMSGSWVTTTTVTPCSRLSVRMTSMISWEVLESRLPVGSSARRIAGWLIRALARATRCCWPPDSWLGRLCSRSARPSAASTAFDRSMRSLGRSFIAAP